MSMEPNKMEEDFRKKLNEREIEPSGAAWDRLDAMLSVAEKTTPQRNFRWLYIAAGLAIFFTVGVFLFQQEKPIQELDLNTNSIVTSEEETKINEISGTSEQEMISKESSEAVAEGSSSDKLIPQKKSTINKTIHLQESVAKEEIAQESSQIKPEIQVGDKIEKQEIIADTPIVISEKPKEKTKVKVNVNSLLSAVEGELNQEFRETTLQKLSRNFKTVKTAVANRNYE